MARSVIDLSRLPPPDAVKPLDYETLWNEIVADVVAAVPAAAPVLALKSELLTMVLRVVTYRILLMRNEMNQSVRAVMPALAQKSDLDHVASIVGVFRLVIDEGDPANGVAPTMESDDDLRRRMVLAPAGFSVAGPDDAYKFHALSADGGVKDASPTSPEKGVVLVTVLARAGDGTASPALLDIVRLALTPTSTRPLTDNVLVQSATIRPYAIRARVWTFGGPDPAVVIANSRKSIEKFVEDSRFLGRDINESSLKAALTVPGVQRVKLVDFDDDLILDDTECGYCTEIEIIHEGLDD